MTAAEKRRFAMYELDGYTEWQVMRAESVRHAAGLKEDEEFPPHVYPAPRIRSSVEASTAVSPPVMADLPLPALSASAVFEPVCPWSDGGPARTR